MLVAGAAVAGVVTLLDRARPRPPVAERCVAHLEGTDWSLSPDQAQNAALVSSLAVRRGLPARAVTIGLATALQESRLENIDYGDRDSIGLFQQRPSQGWGTVEQIMDPVYSTTKFFEGLEKVPGYQDMPVTQAAQAVQRSGFPDAYAQHEGRSRAWASALTGWSPAALRCTLRPVETPTGTGPVVDRVARDWGDLPATAHVADGQALARRYGVPRRVQDMIAQHHGTGLVGYFYRRASQSAGHPVDDRPFRYLGPRPQSREAGIMLLADSVEAAVRASRDHSPENVTAIIRKIVQERIDDGQLDECDLTLRDLDRIRRSFATVLQGIFHPRIEYPTPPVVARDPEQPDATLQRQEA